MSVRLHGCAGRRECCNLLTGCKKAQAWVSEQAVHASSGSFSALGWVTIVSVYMGRLTMGPCNVGHPESSNCFFVQANAKQSAYTRNAHAQSLSQLQITSPAVDPRLLHIPQQSTLTWPHAQKQAQSNGRLPM